jgi:hypothetical protein
MTAHVCCSGCDTTFKLAVFGPNSWRAATSDLQQFLEDHHPCREACGDQPPFTLRYNSDRDS